jgi:hypothetical protein
VARQRSLGDCMRTDEDAVHPAGSEIHPRMVAFGGDFPLCSSTPLLYRGKAARFSAEKQVRGG